MILFLCGFMGSGKTSFLNLLESDSSFQKNSSDFIDLDDAIFKRYSVGHLKLADLIMDIGWEKFRSFEKLLIDEYLEAATAKDLVVALGGGALSEASLQTILGSQVASLIFLDTPFEVCLERIKNSEERPLAKIGHNKLKELFDTRLKLYKKADLILTSSEQKDVKVLNCYIKGEI